MKKFMCRLIESFFLEMQETNLLLSWYQNQVKTADASPAANRVREIFKQVGLG